MKMYCAPARPLAEQARTSVIHSSECFMQASLLGVPAGEIARMSGGHGFVRAGVERNIAAIARPTATTPIVPRATLVEVGAPWVSSLLTPEVGTATIRGGPAALEIPRMLSPRTEGRLRTSVDSGSV